MKQRLDILLVERNFFTSRERAKRNIMAGKVLVDNRVIDKAGMMIDADAEIRVKEDVIPYVSRGGLKLEKAMKSFLISLENKVCMDIGASTGGFTDCMLRNGATRVYSVDVGYGQLDWKLRNDDRVVVLERTNIRKLTTEKVDSQIDFFSIDVSFISLKLVFPTLRTFSKEYFQCVALIKPQFEVGKEEVGKNGVVRDASKHKKAIEMCVGYAKENNFRILGLTWSPIRGPKGNIEYLLYFDSSENEDCIIDIDKVVSQSHEEDNVEDMLC
ncbi:TlyA family RNA methyltransferase [Filifactor alocis]